MWRMASQTPDTRVESHTAANRLGELVSAKTEEGRQKTPLPISAGDKPLEKAKEGRLSGVMTLGKNPLGQLPL